MKYFLSTALIFAIALIGSLNAYSQTELTLLAPGSAKDALEQIVPGFETQTGYKVKAAFASGGKVKQQIIQGGAFDVSILQLPLDEVLASGNVAASSQTAVASVAVGVAVKKGAPKPDISTPEAVKRMLLAAKSISYPDPAVGGASAVSFQETMKKLGITEQMKPKIKLSAGGSVSMEMTANGDVEMGLIFVSEMVNPGIDIVGELPVEISTPTTFYGFVSSHTKNSAAAQALLDYLASPNAAAGYKAARMSPAH